jgi:hypothetical protein
MRLVNESVLDLFRGPGRCEWCQRRVLRREAHHVFGKGAGRVDIPGNAAGLCAAFSGGLHCHHEFHAGHITRGDLLAVTAAREGCTQADIEHDVFLVRRLPQGTPLAEVYRRLRSVRPKAFTPPPLAAYYQLRAAT